MSSLNSSRLALAAGVWLTVVYAVCVAALVILGIPPWSGMYLLWQALLIGFDPVKPWTLGLGAAEAFAYGAFGAWAFAAIYNALPIRRAAPPQEFAGTRL